jgi:hypothetical protein
MVDPKPQLQNSPKQFGKQEDKFPAYKNDVLFYRAAISVLGIGYIMICASYLVSGTPVPDTVALASIGAIAAIFGLKNKKDK